jgi:hypothetical protein
LLDHTASRSAWPFAVIPEWLLRAPISADAKVLYGLLYRCIDGPMPDSKALAAMLDKAPTDTVDRALGELLAIGVLQPVEYEWQGWE